MLKPETEKIINLKQNLLKYKTNFKTPEKEQKRR